MAHPGYLAHAGTPRTPKDLEGHATLAYSLSQTLWTLKQGRRSEVLLVKPLLRANSSLALLGALRQRLGIARMPLFVVGQELARGRLVRVLPGWALPESPIHAVTTARSHLPRKTRAFIDFFRARLGEPPPWE